ncbi:MAG: hypothetical protein K2X66_02605 [Cyanobacteria bacterium]|nr:hypothetical protein [Cyanobacteriota bacterium]
MDSFSIIQNFFTSMHCNLCTAAFDPEGIELLRKEDGFFIVSVTCKACDTQIGVAMVGIEGNLSDLDESDLELVGARPLKAKRFKDPELTEAELERFSQFDTVSFDDVLDAHQFFSTLDGDWTQHVPTEILERCKDSHRESSTEQTPHPRLDSD